MALEQPPSQARARAHTAIAFAVKMAAGTALFILVLIAVQSRDARIAGMMLTFPALNGISLMLAPVADKRAMARAMLAVIALNGVVGLGFIGAFAVLSRMAMPGLAALVPPLAALAFVVWLGCVWLLGRIGIRAERTFVRGFLLLAPLAAVVWWVSCPPRVAGAILDPVDLVAANATRVVLFALSLGLVLAVGEWSRAGHGLLGRLGAFPVLPLFSLAMIADAEAASGGLLRFPAVAPAVLVGLLLAMAFARIYAEWLMWLRQARVGERAASLLAFAGLVGGWIACGALIYGGMAVIAALEGCR